MTRAQRRAAMPRRLRIIADVGGAILAAAVGAFIARYPADLSWPIVAAIALAAAAAYLAWRLAPQYLYTAAVLVFWVTVIPVVTWLFAAVTPEFGLDYEGRLAGLALYGLLIAILAHRTSRGRPWITVAIALVVVTAVAGISYAAHWKVGIWLAYAAGVIVVALRGSVGGWIRDTIDEATEWWTTRRRSSVDLARWGGTNSVELSTADVLTRLDASWRVIHDRVIPGSVDDAETIDHIAVGPPGVAVIASVRVGPGRVQQAGDGSISHHGRSLDRPLRETWWQAKVVTTRTNLPASAILAIHGGTPFEDPLHIGMYEHAGDADEALAGAVTLVHADADAGRQLLSSISGLVSTDSWTRGQIRRYARRVSRAFPAAGQLTIASADQQRRALAGLSPSDVGPTAVHEDSASGPPARSSGAVQVGGPDDAPTKFAPALAGPGVPAAGTDDPGLPKHREYQWDGGPEADAVARQSLEAVMQNVLQPGDRVNALFPDGVLPNWVVVSDAYIHADGVAVIDIAEPADYADALERGTTPKDFVVAVLDDLDRVER